MGEAEARAYVHVAQAKHIWENASSPYTVLLFLENVGATPARSFQVGGELKKVKAGQVSESIKIRPYAMKAWSGLAPGRPHTSVRLDVAEYAELAREFANPVKDHFATRMSSTSGLKRISHSILIQQHLMDPSE